MFDVNVVLENYGLWESPFQVTSCYRRSKAIRRAIYVFLTQMLGAYCSFFLARAFWKLRIHPLHDELLSEQHCSADLTTAVTIGCLIEGGATFLGKAFDRYASEYFEDSRTCTFVTCTFSGFVCALGINYTGMYANPLVAWACTFNCEGLTHVGHLLVYWLSPLIGW
ncbi:unnamed protein product [Nippostrongylus brasiliensis]|uniref:Aquaporin n=1 Tax=Nippostrongylus brasiliensis TaxID=27835 RepID=A0A0N4XGS9_NIPBR|nr:unnamed protein product [Nippostrongylus brasiliensis]